MRRLFNRPRSMSQMFQGRMFNRMSGGYAPSLYSGFRPRRWAHRRFQTQVSPYGAAGGGWGQSQTAPAGHASNVYAQALAQAEQGGVNLGHKPWSWGVRGSRVALSHRKEQAKIKRAYHSNRASLRKELRGASFKDANRIRRELRRISGQHRVDRRQAAADWSAKRGGISARYGYSVGPNREFQGFRFKQARGFHDAQMERAKKRHMRLYDQRFKGTTHDARYYGGFNVKGSRAHRPTHIDFMPYGRKVIHGGVHREGPYTHLLITGDKTPGLKYRTFHDTWRQDYRHPRHRAPWAREYVRTGGRFKGKKIDYGEYMDDREYLLESKIHGGKFRRADKIKDKYGLNG